MEYPKEVEYKGGTVDSAVEINALLDIIHKTREIPKLSAIGTAALLELQVINKQAQVKLDEYNKQVADREAEIVRIKSEMTAEAREAEELEEEKREEARRVAANQGRSRSTATPGRPRTQAEIEADSHLRNQPRNPGTRTQAEIEADDRVARGVSRNPVSPRTQADLNAEQAAREAEATSRRRV